MSTKKALASPLTKFSIFIFSLLNLFFNLVNEACQNFL